VKTERATAQTPRRTDKEKWAKVKIYTSTHICAGYIYCSHQRRLLDVLNGIPTGPLTSDEFLSVREGELRSPDGKVAIAQSADINKANILFIREFERLGINPVPMYPSHLLKL